MNADDLRALLEAGRRRGRPRIVGGGVRDGRLGLAPKEFDLHIRLNLGKGEALMYAADLTEHYVEFNKGDVTDPTTLGG